MVRERRTRDDQEHLRVELRHGEVALDAAAGVERLRVGHRAGAARHVVVADPLQEPRGVRAAHLDLRERRLVEHHDALAGRAVLGHDRRRPVPSGPAVRAPLLVGLDGVRVVVVHALPAGLLAERRPVRGVPGVRRRRAQRPAGSPLVRRVADVVVALVVLDRSRERVRRRAVRLAEPAYVHVPQVHRRRALEHPLGHDLADAARTSDAVGAEAGRDEEPGDVGRPEAELVVGGERLRPVDERADADVRDGRHAHRGVLADLHEAVVIGREQAAVEVGGDPVVRRRGRGPRQRLALVAAHDEAVDLLAVVDEQVRVAQRRQRRLAVLEHRLGHDVLVAHRHDRHAYADHARDLGGEHAAAVDDELALDVALVGADAGDAATQALALGVDAEHPCVRVELHAHRPCAGRERVGELGGIDLAVGRQVRRTHDPVGDHQREQLLGLGSGDLLQLEARCGCPPGLPRDLLPPLLRRGEADRSALHPAGRVVTRLQRAVELDAVAVHRRQRGVGPQLADQPGGVERRAARELVAVEHHDVALAGECQVVGHRAAAHASPDDDDAGTGGQGAGRRLSHGRNGTGRGWTHRMTRKWSRPLCRDRPPVTPTATQPPRWTPACGQRRP